MSLIIAKQYIKTIGKGCILDGDNILWKLVDGKFIGKRSVWTSDNKAAWIEDTNSENISNYWCGGKDADYTEIFY